MENIAKAKDAFARLKAGKIDEAEMLFKMLLKENEYSFYGNLGMANVWIVRNDESLTVFYVEMAAKTSYSPAEEEKSFIRRMVNDIVTPLDEKGYGKESFLTIATNWDSYTAVKFLLKNGADPNYTSPSGWSSLIFAAVNSSKKYLKPNALAIGELLVDYGATYIVKVLINLFPPEYAPSQEFVAMLNAGPNPERKARTLASIPTAPRKKMRRFHKEMGLQYDLENDGFGNGLYTVLLIVLCLFTAGGLFMLFSWGALIGLLLTALFGTFAFICILPKIRFKRLKAKYMETRDETLYEDKMRKYEEKTCKIIAFKRDFYSICLRRRIRYRSSMVNLGKEIMGDTFSDEELYQIYLRGEEAAIQDENRVYMDYIGASKAIVYCKAQIAHYKSIADESGKRAASAFRDGERMYNIHRESERSWGLAGGIAEGIAGVGAGIAAAVDAQIDNIGIRQRNAELKGKIDRWAGQTWSSNVDTRINAEKKIKFYEEKLQEYPRKLVENGDENKYLKLLNPTVCDIEYREAGAVYMRVNITECEYKISGSVPAVIDGCIKAQIVNKNGDVISSNGYLTLPPFDQSAFLGLRGVANIPAGTDPAGLKVRFVPHHLWAIEA